MPDLTKIVINFCVKCHSVGLVKMGAGWWSDMVIVEYNVSRLFIMFLTIAADM